jgi:hypothetical protein
MFSQTHQAVVLLSVMQNTNPKIVTMATIALAILA